MAKYSFETKKIAPFTEVDYALFGLMLAGSAFIGIFYAIKDRKRNNTKEFLLAGGKMNPIPVALSILASFMSAITLLGTPAEMYNFTTMYWYIGLGYLLVVAAAAHLFIPVFYRLRVTSAYEYLQHRFSKGVRTAGSLTFCTQMILYMAIVLYAPSLALNAVTGFPLWTAIITVGIVCTFYTALGGLKAVLWTDTFQVGVMFAGLFAIVIKGMSDVGGLKEAWHNFDASGRVDWDDFSVDPKIRHSAWSLVIGGMFTWVAIYGTNQAQVQRACSCSTLKEAQIAMWINFPGLCLILYLGCFIGVALYSLYRTCDPLKYDLITATDQLLPLFVMDVLGDIHGVPGLFVASLFSGALSTLSSGLNSIAACILQDVIRAYFVKDMTESRATWISRIIAVIFGVICLGLTYVASKLGGVLQAALSLFGMIGGPLLGLFTLGMIFPWANTAGAYAGLIIGLIFMFWIGIGAYVTQVSKTIPKSPVSVIGCNWNLTTTASTTINGTVSAMMSTVTSTVATTSNVTEAVTTAAEHDGGPFFPLYSLSYLWYSATAVLVVVGIGLIVSFITGANKGCDADPKLMIPLFDIMFPFLPEKILKPLRFGVRYDTYAKPSGMVVDERDIRHTADELEEGDVNKYFDIELDTRADDNKKKASNGNLGNGDVQVNGDIVKADETIENEIDHPYSKQNSAYVADTATGDNESTRL
ncbi:sodium-coupled monocarboxylate transporter 1-like isoform X1 [Ruditapes philippinarum]|uniref:sodium-coupled monocarboxylate transporter 1-like isoform X1 n=1 Tax=Ruditapes philippinarum TaxID=129788 RepID=UPI00295B6507|nr:sodium-coupled monocarboxylate transporter 1-like isoform X1 [Ruditapes philippinarum]